VSAAAGHVSAGHRSPSAGLASDAGGAVGGGFEMGGGADQRIGLCLELVRCLAVGTGADGRGEEERNNAARARAARWPASSRYPGGVFESGGALG
jgi:hypothetical protein